MIYHLAVRGEWEEARTGGGGYRRSSLGRSLAQEGFIHCSFASQVQTVADLVYRGREDVVLLTIDPSRLEAEVVVEDTAAAGEGYPHVYGPLPVAAVVRVDEVPVTPDGRLEVDPLVAG